MATPMTADQIIAQLKKWRVPYRVIDGWRTRRRDPEHGAWGPVHGFGVHHTGDDAADDIDRNLITKGYAGLPGPLAQFGCNDDGVIDVIGCGRANHFGGGDPDVLKAVIAEDYGDYPPAPNEHTGSAGAVDGNTHFYGVETYYSGSHVPTAEAYRSLVLLSCAVCDFHGWTAKSVIGHKEWSDWKGDPGRVDMKGFRADVAAKLKAGPVPPATHVTIGRRKIFSGLEELAQVSPKRTRIAVIASGIRTLAKQLPTR